jgi:hypothetical protein
METLIQRKFNTWLKIIDSISTTVAITSFAIGTLLFGAYKLYPVYDRLLVIGLLYVAIAFILNLVVFLNLFILFVKVPAQREYYAVKMLIILANLPVAYLYFILLSNQNFKF